MKTLLIILLLVLIGCDGRYLGQKEGKVVLEGERIPAIEVNDPRIIEEEGYNTEIVLPKPLPLENWEQAGGLTHHSLQHLKSKSKLELAYSRSIGNGRDYRNRLLAEPIVVDGFIYTLDVEGSARKIRLDDGEIIWTKHYKSRFSPMGHVLKGAGLAYENDKLFVSLGSGELYAVSPEDGAVLWNKGLPSPFRSAALIYGGRVYALTADNKLIVLSTYDGEELWSNDFGSIDTTIMGASVPAADMGIVVLGLNTGEIVALRSDNGLPLWRDSLSSGFSISSIDNMLDIKGRIIIDDDIVYVSSNLKTAAFNFRSGEIIWEKEIGSINNPYLAGEYLFILTSENYLLTLSAKNGEMVAGIKLPLYTNNEDKVGRIFWVGPILVQDKLIIAGSNGEIHAYSPYTGKLLEKLNLSGSFSLPPIAVLDSILFINDNGQVMVYQ